MLAYGHDAADVAFISDYGLQPLQLDDMRVWVTALDEGIEPDGDRSEQADQSGV